MGLGNMADRAAALGGSFDVDSRPARGTRVLVDVPLPPAVDPAPPAS